MLKYLIILFAIALAVAPLTNFLPSKRQRKLARMREQAAVGGLFVELRNLPSSAAQVPAARAAQQVIYYGLRLKPSRNAPRQRLAWLRENDDWEGLQRRSEPPLVAAALPPTVRALGMDEGSCGVYWHEDGEEDDVAVIVSALKDWELSLSGG